MERGKKVRLVLFFLIMLIMTPVYLYWCVLYDDSHTVFEIRDCTKGQQEEIAGLLGLEFPEGIVLTNIRYKAKWGNDVSRNFLFEAEAASEHQFAAFVKNMPEEYDGYGLYGVEADGLPGRFLFHGSVTGGSALEELVRTQGRENTGEKNAVFLPVLLGGLFLDCLLLLPYGKLFKKLNAL